LPDRADALLIALMEHVFFQGKLTIREIDFHATIFNLEACS
jgi:hypothetical protein